MTAPRRDRTRLQLPSAREFPARRDNPAAPQLRARSHLRQPRSYTMPDIPPRPRRSRKNEQPLPETLTPEELDRWDAEWRDEWDRGDIDDSAAYAEDELDVAEQTRDVEWLLDALDALDDAGDDDAFDWDE